MADSKDRKTPSSSAGGAPGTPSSGGGSDSKRSSRRRPREAAAAAGASSPASGAGAPSSPPGPPQSSSPMRRGGSLLEDGDEGEDILENAANDYKPMPELDEYEKTGLDEREFDELPYSERKRVEDALAKRDAATARRTGRIGRLPAAMLDDADDNERPRQRQRLEDRKGLEDDDSETINLDDHRGPVRDFLLLEGTRKEIRKRFRRFLTEFSTSGAGGEHFYPPRINTMCSKNEQSLEVSYIHLSNTHPVLAVWLADEPELMLEMFDDTLWLVVTALYKDYDQVVSGVYVRIVDLPIVDKIRNLRTTHLNAFIKVEGVVTRRSSIFPQLLKVKYTCQKCSTDIGPIVQQSNERESGPQKCPECQGKGPFTINTSETIYRNFQKITLQESPGSVPAGRIPRSKDVILLHDLIDKVVPGEEVQITGVYRHTYDNSLNSQNGFPVFSTAIHANSISKQSENSAAFSQVTVEEEQEIRKLSQDPNVATKIFQSLAPSIHGHNYVKMGVAMAMFGGEPKKVDKHTIRGDINVLIMGDPGTAKSQFLKYCQKTAKRAVYTTGKGASAVGLTASVRLDPLTREWTLEGGALVLADRGLCLIDEFDKMNDHDRTSIHEAMEQQSISISKAGIIASLKARCSVIAAANPESGRYDAQKTFAENVQLSDAILSRFDVMCVVRDTVDRDNDLKLAQFVVDNHTRSHPERNIGAAAPAAASSAAAAAAAAAGAPASSGPDSDAKMSDGAAPKGKHGKKASKPVGVPSSPATGAPSSSAAKPKSDAGKSDDKKRDEKSAVPPPVPDDELSPIRQDLLRKYIAYARDKCHPRLQNIDNDRIANLYSELRRESMNSGGLPIAPRHVESIIRMSEAHAKMHLRQEVTEEDVNMAIRVMLESFIGAQKYAVKSQLRKHFEKYLTYKEDGFELLLHALQEVVKETVRYRHFTRQKAIQDAEAQAVADEIRARQSGIAAPVREPLPAMEAADAPVRIPLDEFQQKASRLAVSDVQPFFKSAIFAAANFRYDAKTKEIVHTYV